mmetsp:Transcript_6167/g.14803  ORF Transcript_6167/g.14803 Transcript_6167/m.14803 type:complete len:232 (+) Transcript_6167:1198-1893(+)
MLLAFNNRRKPPRENKPNDREKPRKLPLEPKNWRISSKRSNGGAKKRRRRSASVNWRCNAPRRSEREKCAENWRRRNGGRKKPVRRRRKGFDAKKKVPPVPRPSANAQRRRQDWLPSSANAKRSGFAWRQRSENDNGSWNSNASKKSVEPQKLVDVQRKRLLGLPKLLVWPRRNVCERLGKRRSEENENGNGSWMQLARRWHFVDGVGVLKRKNAAFARLTKPSSAFVKCS